MKKVIICTVSIVLVVVVGLTALIMSLISVGENNFITKPTAIYLLNATTSDNGETGVFFDPNSPLSSASNKAEIDKIYNAFNEGFSQKALNALFKGELNDKVKTHYESSVATEKYIKRDGDSTHLTLVFYYEETQKITANNKTYEYNYLFFQIDSSSERNEVVFGVSKTVSFSSTSSPLSYNYWFTAKTNTSKLYDYIASQKYLVDGAKTQIIDSRDMISETQAE